MNTLKTFFEAIAAVIVAVAAILLACAIGVAGLGIIVSTGVVVRGMIIWLVWTQCGLGVLLGVPKPWCELGLWPCVGIAIVSWMLFGTSNVSASGDTKRKEAA